MRGTAHAAAARTGLRRQEPDFGAGGNVLRIMRRGSGADRRRASEVSERPLGGIVRLTCRRVAGNKTGYGFVERQSGRAPGPRTTISPRCSVMTETANRFWPRSDEERAKQPIPIQ